MNVARELFREYHRWRQCPRDRLRWLLRERRNPLSNKMFKIGTSVFPYFIHPYNHTWANERAVEVPVAHDFMSHADPATTLEIGNVLSHYFESDHTVVDLNEDCRYRPVINCDLIDYAPTQDYKRIISISTVEHVGWDEDPRNEHKVMNAFPKLRSMLAPDGEALITIPVGYNLFLDQKMRDGAVKDVDFRCMKRISKDNQWIETSLEEALQCRYGQPFVNANAVVFIYLSENVGTH